MRAGRVQTPAIMATLIGMPDGTGIAAIKASVLVLLTQRAIGIITAKLGALRTWTRLDDRSLPLGHARVQPHFACLGAFRDLRFARRSRLNVSRCPSILSQWVNLVIFATWGRVMRVSRWHY